MNRNRWILVFCLIIVSVVLTACGTTSPYKLQSSQEYGVTVQRFIPQTDISASEEQVIVKLPGGDYPDLKWTTHNTGQCLMFELNDSNMVRFQTEAGEGTQFPTEKSYQISCPTGERIWWERTLPTAPTSTPAK